MTWLPTEAVQFLQEVLRYSVRCFVTSPFKGLQESRNDRGPATVPREVATRANEGEVGNGEVRDIAQDRSSTVEGDQEITYELCTIPIFTTTSFSLSETFPLHHSAAKHE